MSRRSESADQQEPGSAAQAAPRIGVSRCLLGDEVRFDGGHKHDRYVTGALAPYVQFVSVCPEVEAGFGVPREAMHLEGEAGLPRLVTVRTQRDLTETMRAWANDRVDELARLDLDGFVLKSKSPSCGMERVPVYGERGVAPRRGRGLFAAALLEALPELPVEEDGRLNDPCLRENFVVRVFVHHRWRQASRAPLRKRALLEFHTRHKLLLMSRDEQCMRTLGRLVAAAGEDDLGDLFEAYRRRFFRGMSHTPTTRKHTNTLQHVAGHLRGRIDDWDRRELADVIDRYRRGELPLIVPVTLLRHYIQKFDIPYVRNQVYLTPHPQELMLLNRV
jgi:uncharacterized protein YbgA (DUF1722 family)/uncharacterized protein YbbK (DUF523 family)